MYYGKVDPRLGYQNGYSEIWKAPLAEMERMLEETWERIRGTRLDLKHPRTFTEKMAWYRLYYNHPDLSRCIDKVTFKDYIREKLGEGYTAKLYRVWNSPDEVNFDGLPEQFVVKSNAQARSRYMEIVKDRDSFDLEGLKQEICDYWFFPQNLLINRIDRGYFNVKPKVLVEEYLEETVRHMYSYKFFCFHGKPECAYVSSGNTCDGEKRARGEFVSHISFYSLDWKMIDVKYGKQEPFENVPKPEHFQEMMEISRILSADFPFVRVDFYDTKEKLYLGELTFTSGGYKTTFDPPEFDLYLGSLLRLEDIDEKYIVK